LAVWIAVSTGIVIVGVMESGGDTPAARAQSVREAKLMRPEALARLESARAHPTYKSRTLRVAVPATLLAGIVTTLCLAALLWLPLAAIGEEVSLRATWSVTVHALLPQAYFGASMLAIHAVYSDVNLLATDRLLSLSFLIPQGSGRLGAMVRSIDLIEVWTVALLAVGGGVLARGRFAYCAVVVSGAWLIMLAAKVALLYR
jgi:hypothetical protein